MEYSASFSSFSVADIDAARQFYNGILGIEVHEMMGLKLLLKDGGRVHVYQKDNHQSAEFTVLNFVVADIDAAIDELTGRGIIMEQYDNMPAPQDQKGVLRGLAANMGPDIAWFKDPSGNILSVLQEK